jgi:hypothetical protein
MSYATMDHADWMQKQIDVARRHPSLDEAVAEFRAYLPSDHRIIYKPAIEATA